MQLEAIAVYVAEFVAVGGKPLRQDEPRRDEIPPGHHGDAHIVHAILHVIAAHKLRILSQPGAADGERELQLVRGREVAHNLHLRVMEPKCEAVLRVDSLDDGAKIAFPHRDQP